MLFFQTIDMNIMLKINLFGQSTTRIITKRAEVAEQILRRKRKEIAQKAKQTRIHLENRTALAKQKYLQVKIVSINNLCL